MNRYDALFYPKFYNANNRKTWRYYMHLAGQYHPADLDSNGRPKIKVLSVDTLEEIEFTVENLKEHRATLREYQKGSTYYQNLTQKYPDQIKLINGIINPIDINKAIEADENTILWYDKDLVEPNEYGLIPKVQKYIHAFMNRYNNPDYEIGSDLYIPAKYMVLYTFLPYIIMSARYEFSRTIEAHSFHVWAYLGSHQYLDEYKDHLTLFQRMWLYRNIRWVELNPGKTRTFNKLIDVVMTHRNLPLSEFFSDFVYDKMLGDEKAMYPEIRFRRSPLNLHDTIRKDGKYRTTKQMVDSEVPEARDNALDWNIEMDVKHAEHVFTRGKDQNLSTKVLESTINTQSNRSAINTDDVELNTWIYMATNGTYTARISVPNPKNASVMALSQREAVVLFIYSLMRSYGLKPDLIPTITVEDVLKVKRPTLEHVRTMIDETITPPEYVYALDHYTPSVPNIISVDEFAEWCSRVIETKNTHRYIYSFNEYAREHIQIKQARDQYYEDVVCKLTDTNMTFDEFMKMKGWEIGDLRQSDYEALANNITTEALGSNLVKRYSVREIQGMMVRLLKKLSSYTIQFLTDSSEVNTIIADWAYLRYQPIGTKGKLVERLNLTTVDVRNLTMKVFHKWDETLFGKTKPINEGSGKGYAKSVWKDNDEDGDSDNLILNMTGDGRVRMRSSIRMPTVGFTSVKQELKPAQPPAEPTHDWNLDKFHIHTTTEDRSRVIVDKDGTLIVRGVVYKEDDK
nr:MAG TPA: hypothetical protein [Caudoviricetes sp.]